MKNNWPRKKLGEVADIIEGYAFKSKDLKNFKSSENYLPVIKIGNLKSSGGLVLNNLQYFEFTKNLTKFLIKKNDILVAMTGATTGKGSTSDIDQLLLNQRVGLIRAKREIVLQNYLKSIILSDTFYKYCQISAGGGAQGNISPSQIMDFTLPLPNLGLQQKIVERLDAIRKAQELCDTQIQKTEELFESTMFHEVKTSGKEVNLSEITDFQEGPGILAKDFRTSGIPLVRLKGTIGPEVTLEGCNFLDPEMVNKKWRHYLLKKGDMLVTTSASLGQVSEVTDIATGAIAYTGIIRFRPANGSLNRRYLKYFLSSEIFKTQTRSAATGGVIKHFGPTHLKRMKISFPPLVLQLEIVKKLDAIQDYKKLLLKQKSLLKELFDSVLCKSIGRETD